MDPTPTVANEEKSTEKPESNGFAAGTTPDGPPSDATHTRPRSTKFRFKSSKRRGDRSADDKRSSRRENDEYSTHERSHRRHGHRHHHHHHHHRSSKRRKTHEHSPSPPSNDRERSLSPETAFRESLFDAMADDEGAAFWESVYGQPIHTYTVPQGPEGELERMTEEEYAAYVRARMWERSHEGIMAERERQRRERAKAKQEADAAQRRDYERVRFDQALEESLRRGEARRRAKSWKAVWDKYLSSWEELNAAAAANPSDSGNKTEFYIRNKIHWPVESGKRRDISRDEIKQFLSNAPVATAEAKKDNLVSTLKTERVRWHPDKMLHRYGSLGLSEDKSLIQSVTEVFQILDQLWTEMKT